jgi:hypothetical protein
MRNAECGIKEFCLFYFYNSGAKRHQQFVNRHSTFVIHKGLMAKLYLVRHGKATAGWGMGHGKGSGA